MQKIPLLLIGNHLFLYIFHLCCAYNFCRRINPMHKISSAEEAANNVAADDPYYFFKLLCIFFITPDS
jgi:hypothetical protein